MCAVGVQEAGRSSSRQNDSSALIFDDFDPLCAHPSAAALNGCEMTPDHHYQQQQQHHDDVSSSELVDVGSVESSTDCDELNDISNAAAVASDSLPRDSDLVELKTEDFQAAVETTSDEVRS